MAAQQLATGEQEKRNLKFAKELAKLCDENRGEEILVLDMRKVCDFTDAFVLVTAHSGPQMKALSREVEKNAKTAGFRQLARSGVNEGHWVVLDYGDLVVHLFTPETRDFYRLEEMWGDAKRLRWR